MQGVIRYTRRKDIDSLKWEECLKAAPNALLYAETFYLDFLSKQWDALVLNDYEAVMPLTWNRKYGFYYLYQPFFCPSLGVFGKNVTAETVKLFLDNIPRRFRLWDIYLNKGNVFNVPGYDIYRRRNYVLPFEKSYEQLYAGFDAKHKVSIRKAVSSGCYSRKNISIQLVIQLAQEESNKDSPISDLDYERFANLYKWLDERKCAITIGIYNSQDDLVSSGAFFFWNKRAYFALEGNARKGRSIGASHFLVNEFVREYAGQFKEFDCEGSDIDGIARFLRRFGSVEEHYAAIKVNKLPPLVRFFKK
jgi:hypothetical protein